ncbi:MAG: AsmA-like C-terminal domain-containing protein, partial [Pseudomonadota bacterium]
MLTALHIAYRSVFWLFLGLVFALALFVLRLNAGSIELAWLKPHIEAALTPENDALAVTTDRIELRFNKERRTLELIGVNLRFGRTMEGQTVGTMLAFPEVDLALSIEAFLKHGLIAASRVHADAPSLVVERNEDGVIDLHLDAEDDRNMQGVDIGALIQRFMHPAKPDERIAFLRTLEISGGRVAFYDRLRARALTTRNADLRLRRQEGGVDAWLRAEVAQPSSEAASLRLTATMQPNSDRLPFAIDIAGLMPADLPEIWPFEAPVLPAELSGVRVPITASIQGEIKPDGSHTGLTFDLLADRGMIDWPDHLAEPLDIEMIGLKGKLADDLGSVDIDHALIVSRGAKLGASGHVAWTGEAPLVELDLDARDVRAEDLPAFWPPQLGDDAREWVVENIETGRVTSAEARLELRPDDFGPEPLRDEAIRGMFAFEELSVRYIDEMPRVVDASGTVTFDADRMAFDVRGGANAGVTLSDGQVIITGMGKPGRTATQLRVIANAEGSMETVLALLDHPPLDVAKDLEIAPSSTSGRVAAEIKVRLPLHKEVTEDEAIVLAEAELADVVVERLPKLPDDIGLDQGRFSLILDEDKVRLNGAAAVSGIPLQIDVIEPLDEDASTRRIVLDGRLSREQLKAQGLPVDGLGGEFGFVATVTETGTQFWVDLEADLTSLAVAPEGIAWEKQSGEAGLVRASLVMPVDGPIDVKHFELLAGDLSGSGSFQLSDGRLQSLVVNQFRLADSQADIRYARDDDGGYDIVIEAERLDLDALFGDEPKQKRAAERFDAIIRADQLKISGVELIDVQADASHGIDGWRSASAIGTLPAGGKVVLELTAEGDGDDRRLELRSDNAGALIEALDLGQRVDGGSLSLSARLEAQDPVLADGRFEITDFLLQDAPLLARMLTLASLSGIGNLLGGKGIQMDHLLLPFSYRDGRLTLSDGLLRGSELGLTVKGDVVPDKERIDLEGTIIPIYTLNRLLGQVPVLGRILTGTDGRGAFAATYTIEGPA